MDSAQLAKLDYEIEWLEAHPHLHKQSDYISKTQCGTAFCVAGHLAVDEGKVVLNENGWYVKVDPYFLSYEEFGAETLGIEFGDESDMIFRDWLTLDHIKYGRDVLAQRYGHPLAYNETVDDDWDPNSVDTRDEEVDDI